MNKVLKRILQFVQHPGRRPAPSAAKGRPAKPPGGQYGAYGSE